MSAMLNTELFFEENTDLDSKSIYTTRFEIKSWLSSLIFKGRYRCCWPAQLAVKAEWLLENSNFGLLWYPILIKSSVVGTIYRGPLPKLQNIRKVMI